MPLDLSADVVTLTQQLVDIESVSHHEQEIADAVEAALRALPHLTVTRRGHTLVARTELGRGERVVIAGHLDTVPLNDNLPSRLEDGILARPRHLRHEGWRRGDAQARRRPHRARPRPHLHLLRGRGGRLGPQRAAQAHRERPRPAGGRLRDPHGAEQRRRRGRLPGHDARRRPHHGGAVPLGPQLEGRQRDPQGGARPRAAQRLRRPPARHRRAGVPRGPQRHRHPRRRRRQRDPRRVRRRGQLPLRARPQRAGRRGVRPGLLRGLRGHRHRHGGRRDAGPRPARGEGVRRGRRRRGRAEVRLDRRRPVHQARRAGRQLRTGRPDVRPQAGRARPGRAHRAVRARAAHVARRHGGEQA